MGSRGPIADPNRRLRGRPERRTTVSDLTGFPPIADEPPLYLTGPARRRWDAAIAALPAAGVVLTVADAATLMRWAVLAGRMDTLNDEINRLTAEGRDVDRLLRSWLRLSAVVDGLAKAFGMTPASRRRLGVSAPTTATDEFESFRSHGKGR